MVKSGCRGVATKDELKAREVDLLSMCDTMGGRNMRT